MAQLIGVIWNNFLLNPMVNITIAMARVLFNNYGLSIIVFTLVLRLVTLPLTIRQVHSQRKMQLLQPRINDIQKKTKSDPKKRSEETMKLYKEEGVNPAGCVLPMLIQFPIWIALYDVIRDVLGSTPESLINLSGKLYPWSFVQGAVPVNNHFLFWDMGKPDAFVLPLLVGGSMWLQQKLTMTQASMQPGNDSQAQTNQMLLWMMPLMFGWFTTTVPSGLGIYWLVTNLMGIIMNYYVFGWKGANWRQVLLTSSAAAPKSAASGVTNKERRERARAVAPVVDEPVAPPAARSLAGKRDGNGRNGRGGSKRKDTGGGDRQGSQPPRSRSESGGGGDS